MTEEKIIDAFIKGLEAAGLVEKYQKLFNDRALQIKTKDGRYFNVRLFPLKDKDRFIVSKLK